MVITIHQPNYLPWLGFFDKIKKSDIFVILDDAEYSKNCFINRNKIKTENGGKWITLPVNCKSKTKILDVKLNSNINWKRKHINTLKMNYSKSAYFNMFWNDIEFIFEKNHISLKDLCNDFILYFISILDISCDVIYSSHLDVNSNSSQRILDICNILSADEYISGANGKDYLIEDSFKDNNIKITYQDYKHPIYNQLHGEFIPYMSIVDVLFNEGVGCKHIL